MSTCTIISQELCVELSLNESTVLGVGAEKGWGATGQGAGNEGTEVITALRDLMI